MNLTLSTETFDIDGAVTVKPLATSDFGTVTRRVSKVKTLDGGAVINDGGYSVADTDFIVFWQAKDKDSESNASRLVKEYSTLICSCEKGLFKVVPESYQSAAITRVKLLVLEKLA